MVIFLMQSDIFYQFKPTQVEFVANMCQEVVLNFANSRTTFIQAVYKNWAWIR